MVRETSDRDLEARINNHLGTLYWKNRKFKESLVCYQKSYRNYKICRDTIGIINTMQNIGECMRESGQLDSAYHYLDGALKLARQGGITSYTAYLLSSLGNIYTEKKLYEKALAYKKASLNYSEKRNTIYSCYYSIGKLYGNLHKLDSALLFAEMALASTDLYVECGANWLIYTLYVKKQDYKKACTYNERYLLLRDSIEQVYQPQKLAKVEALYNKERLISKQNQQMHTARSRQDFLLICFLCACLAIGIVYVIMFQIISKHKLRNKEIQKLLQKNESLLLSDKQEMEKKDIALQTIQKQLEENHLLIDSLTETIQTLENDNLSQLEIYKQQQEEANIEQSKLLKEKETILKQKEELISNKDILLRQKDTQLQSNQPIHTFFSHFCTYLFYIEGNGKEGKIHEDLVLSKMAETFVIHIVFHLSEHGFRFYASLSSVFQPFLGAELLFGFLPVFSEPVIQFYRPVSFCFKTTAS